MIIPGVSHGLANKEFSSKVRNVNNISMGFLRKYVEWLSRKLSRVRRLCNLLSDEYLKSGHVDHVYRSTHEELHRNKSNDWNGIELVGGKLP